MASRSRFDGSPRRAGRRPALARVPLCALAALLAAGALLQACKSPLDPDTPRRRMTDAAPIDSQHTPPQWRMVSSMAVEITTNQANWSYTAHDTACRIFQANGLVPFVRCSGIYRTTGAGPRENAILESLRLRIDSMQANRTYDLFGDPRHAQGIWFVLGRRIDSLRVVPTDTVIAQSGTVQPSTMSWTHDAAARTITGHYYGTVQSASLPVTAVIRIRYN